MFTTTVSSTATTPRKIVRTDSALQVKLGRRLYRTRLGHRALLLESGAEHASCERQDHVAATRWQTAWHQARPTRPPQPGPMDCKAPKGTPFYQLWPNLWTYVPRANAKDFSSNFCTRRSRRVIRDQVSSGSVADCRIRSGRSARHGKIKVSHAANKERRQKNNCGWGSPGKGMPFWKQTQQSVQ